MIDVASDLILTESGDRKRRSEVPWLRHQDVNTDRTEARNGEVVDLLTSSGDFRGRGFFSREGSPAVTVISSSKVTVDREFFRSRLENALRRRKQLPDDPLSYRLVHFDGDYLPGLVVDRYGDRLVVQFRHPTIEKLQDLILESLEDLVSPRSIYARNDFEARNRHGLEAYKGLLRGDPIPDKVHVKREPYEIVTDLKSGQKTGYYLDQSQNQKAFGRFLTGGTGLDCFSYAGSWGLQALHSGAETVTFVDQSESALELVRENLRLNGWNERSEIIRKDAFDYLNELNRGNQSFDFIVLDPPAFAKSVSQREQAENGYKEINLRAMRMLDEGGILATNSCSAPIGHEHFVDIVHDSARDAHTDCRILEARCQPSDHPWRSEVSATRYLDCLICEINLL